MPKLLILNADDYGLDPLVNEAICELFRVKRISQTSVLINAPYIASAMEVLLPLVSPTQVGLHLNFTEGQSLGKHYKTLTDAQKNFFSKEECYARFEANKMDLSEVKEECFLQLEAIKRWIPFLTHLDSHHHIHLFPKILEAIAPILQEQGVKTIRLPLEDSQASSFYTQKAISLLPVLQSYGFRACSHFFGLNLLDSPNFQATKSLRQFFEDATSITLEWMFHPGKTGAYFYGSERLPPEAREREFHFLNSDAFLHYFPLGSYPRGTYYDLLNF